jgi:hypothetical protein
MADPVPPRDPRFIKPRMSAEDRDALAPYERIDELEADLAACRAQLEHAKRKRDDMKRRRDELALENEVFRRLLATRHEASQALVRLQGQIRDLVTKWRNLASLMSIGLRSSSYRQCAHDLDKLLADPPSPVQEDTV